MTNVVTEYAPILASLGAVAMAVQSWRVSRNKPKVDEVTAEKIKTEIARDQETARLESSKANARRDRHLVRLENWAYTKVRPAWRIAVQVNERQNALLVELAARAEMSFVPQELPELPDPPLIEDID